MTNLWKWKKLTHVPRVPTSTVKPKGYEDKTQMFLRSQSVRCLLSHVIVDAIADSVPQILLVPNVVLNSLFSRNQWWFTTDSRQMVTLYMSLMYSITKWTCNENLSQTPIQISHLCHMKYWSKFLQLCIVSAFAYTNSRPKNTQKIFDSFKCSVS